MQSNINIDTFVQIFPNISGKGSSKNLYFEFILFIIEVI